ncbi:MAG: oligosaccharide flippase family protein [Nitrospira sp.]
MKLIGGVAAISIATVVGQAATVLATPVLTRLYAPNDIGEYAVFASFLGILGTTASLHYELAIPLPRAAKDARLLVLVASLISLALAVLLALAISVGEGVALLSDLGRSLLKMRFMMPFALALTGIGTSLTYYSIRKQSFRRNAGSKVLQAATQAITQVLAGLLGLGWMGLVGGQLIGIGLSILPLVDPTLLVHRNSVLARSVKRMIVLGRRYQNFPLLAAPASVLSAVCNNIPALLLAAYFGMSVAGFYGLGMRVLQLPARVFGQSLSQVFLGSAADALRRGELADLVGQVFRALAASSLHVFVPIGLLAHSLFKVLFGAAWGESATYVVLLLPWVMIAFLSTPLSMLVTVMQRQRQDLYFQMGYLVACGLALSVGACVGSARIALTLFGVSGATVLAVKIWWLLGIAGCSRGKLARSIGHESLIAVVANLPTCLVLWAVDSSFWICVWGGAYSILVQLLNLYVRRIYVV